MDTINLQWLNSQVAQAGFTPSACGWQDSDGHAYACSVESTQIDGNGSHPNLEASWNPTTRWLQLGKARYKVGPLTEDSNPLYGKFMAQVASVWKHATQKCVCGSNGFAFRNGYWRCEKCDALYTVENFAEVTQ